MIAPAKKAAHKAVFLLGSGLITCLGSGLAAQVPALKSGRAPELGSGRRYHSIGSIEGRERLYTLLQRAIEQALVESGLTADQKKRLALFVGSTCLDLPLHESAYAEAAGVIEKDLTPPALAPGAAAAAGQSRFPIHGPGYANIATWITHHYGIEGPQYTLNTACSSSASALLHARLLLNAGLAEHALVVGAEAYNRLSLEGFGSLLLLAKQGYRPFDRNRDGMLLGEGVGAMVLGHAPRDGDRFPLSLRGANSACDPSSPTNSRPERMAEVMCAALDDAGLDVKQLIGIKAHGTGTVSNDLSEGQGMRLLGEVLPPFTSLKPYTGHTLGGCGTIESLCLLAAWREGFLPATPGFTENDPEIGLSPVSTATPLPQQGAVLCNFFGFGGNNTSLILERA